MKTSAFILMCTLGTISALPQSLYPKINAVSSLENFFHLEHSAQGDNTGRIIGGEDAVPGQFPYQVSIQVQPIFGDKYHKCGGSIVNASIIACAAYCVRGQQISQLEVVAGAQNMKIVEPEQQRIKVASVIVHPEYNPITFTHDAAVIVLTTPLAFSPRVKSIRLPTQNQIPTGKCRNTGWGNSRPGGGTPVIIPDALQVVELNIVDQETCRTAYLGINNIDETMVCAHDFDGGKGSCNGDSGSPLACDDENEEAGPYLAGFTSWGMEEPCGQPNYPTVFTRVAYFSDWLKSL